MKDQDYVLNSLLKSESLTEMRTPGGKSRRSKHSTPFDYDRFNASIRHSGGAPV